MTYRCKGSGHLCALTSTTRQGVFQMAYFCRVFTRYDMLAQCTPIAISIPNHRVAFFLLLNRITHKQFCNFCNNMNRNPSRMRQASLSFSHTYVLSVIGHGRKLLHQVFEFLAVSATEHQLGASCMEGFCTFFGGSKGERKVDIWMKEIRDTIGLPGFFRI